MKEKKHLTFRASDDVLKLDCEMICGDVEICGTDENKFTIERAHRSRIKISENDGVVRIRQIRKPLFHRATLIIRVPSFCVPELSFCSKQGRIRISGGIYGDFRVRYDDAQISLERCTFANADFKGKNLSLSCTDVSVKNSFDSVADEGEVLAENIFCSKMDLRFKNGDIGITDMKCPDSFFSSERGSLNAIMNGTAEDFTLNLVSKHGTCNRESVYGGANALKAYSEYGNIVVDFTENKEVATYGYDDVAEDPCVARRA